MRAEAEGAQAKALAEAEGIGEKLKAEAAGLTEKAAAMAALDDASRGHEEYRLRLEAEKDIRLAGLDVQRQVAEAQATVLATGLENADINIVGGESVFFDRLVSSIALGKGVDGFVQHSETAQALAGPWLDGTLQLHRRPEPDPRLGLHGRRAEPDRLRAADEADEDRRRRTAGQLQQLLDKAGELGLADTPLSRAQRQRHGPERRRPSLTGTRGRIRRRTGAAAPALIPDCRQGTPAPDHGVAHWRPAEPTRRHAVWTPARTRCCATGSPRRPPSWPGAPRRSTPAGSRSSARPAGTRRHRAAAHRARLRAPRRRRRRRRAALRLQRTPSAVKPETTRRRRLRPVRPRPEPAARRRRPRPARRPRLRPGVRRPVPLLPPGPPAATPPRRRQGAGRLPDRREGRRHPRPALGASPTTAGRLPGRAGRARPRLPALPRLRVDRGDPRGPRPGPPPARLHRAARSSSPRSAAPSPSRPRTTPRQARAFTPSRSTSRCSPSPTRTSRTRAWAP